MDKQMLINKFRTNEGKKLFAFDKLTAGKILFINYFQASALTPSKFSSPHPYRSLATSYTPRAHFNLPEHH